MSSYVKNNDSNSTNTSTDSKSVPIVDSKSVPIVDSKSTTNCPRYIKCLLDKSGSMSNMFKALIKGVNTLLLEQRQVAEDSKVEIDIEIYVFNSEISLIRSGSIKDVKDINEDEVNPRGSTALNDGLAYILENSKDKKDVLLFIFTDGEENASQKHRGDPGRQYCKSLIELYTRENNWTVLFGAANIDAYHTSSMYGIDAGNTFNVAPDAPTMGVMMREFSSALKTSTNSNEPINVTSLRQASAPVVNNTFKSRVTFADTTPVEYHRNSTIQSLRSSAIQSLHSPTCVPKKSGPRPKAKPRSLSPLRSLKNETSND